jgi:FixJ family two-component response regulator
MSVEKISLKFNGRPLRIAVLDDEPPVIKALVLILDYCYGDTTITTYSSVNDFIAAFNKNADARRIDLFIASYGPPMMRGPELFQFLLTERVKFPVLMPSAYVGSVPGLLAELQKVREIDVTFISKPMLLEDLRKAIAGAFQRIKAKAPHIILVDDEDWLSEMVQAVLAECLPQATVLSFRNRDLAWEELQRADPDLLITDMNNDNVPGRTEHMGMSGWELLPILAKKEVQYPILVMSGSFSMPGKLDLAREAAGRNLNTSFLTKPFTGEQFQGEVMGLLLRARK